MIRTEANPTWLDPESYVEFLNRGFKNQWDRTSFNWYLRRQFNGRPTDIVVRSIGTRILAGAAFCYRQVADGINPPVDVCIMSAGTTTAGERRRGHYAALLEAGIELCRKRACAALTGFVRRDNGSARGLLQIGAYAVPTHYLAFGPRTAKRPARQLPASVTPLPRRKLDALLASGELARLQRLSQVPGHLQFHYPDPLEWRRQFVHRVNSVHALRVSHDGLALIETVGDTDRLQWLSGPAAKALRSIAALHDYSRRNGRRFFLYCSDDLLAAAVARIGAVACGGYLLVLPIDGNAAAHRLGTGAWRLQSGDRM